MTALACPRQTALKVCAWASDAQDARALLDALGLLQPEPVLVIPRPRLPIARHGSRSGYVRGCRCNRCTFANALYMNRWRHHRAVIVTTRSSITVQCLTTPCGHGRHKAWPGQLALVLETAA